LKTGRYKRNKSSNSAHLSAPDGLPDAAIGGSWDNWYARAGLVALLTFICYLPVLQNDFVSLDDYGYVLDNFHIRSLGPAFFAWAFTDLSAGFWHPLTWISYALDYALWGLKPLGYHLTAILIHAGNTFLTFRLTVLLLDAARQSGHCRSCPDERGASIVAGIVALLFGLHPLHVESVAWISERKDLLCGSFYLLSVIVYLHGTPTPDARSPEKFYQNRHYLLSLLFFIFALASKTMAVSLPIVLLILDWYPLGRIGTLKSSAVVFLEKLPFVAASFFIAITSIVAQQSIGAMALMSVKPLTTRILVACKAVALYLWKMVVPLHLIPYYPYPHDVSLLSVEYALPVLFVAGTTGAVMFMARQKPLWVTIWGVYLIILLPALGIVQVGVHSMGDRFTYLPSLAPFLLTGLGVLRVWVWVVETSWSVKTAVVSLACLCSCGLMYLTLQQISVWKNSMVLWNYVIEAGTPFNPLAYNNRGHVYRDRGEFDKAVSDYSVAITQEPAQAEYLVSRGVALCEKGALEQAMADLDRAIVLSPNEYLAYNNRGTVWFRKGETERAIEDFNRAISLKPSEYLAYQNRGTLFENKGEIDKAISDYSTVLTINPFLAGVYISRGDLSMKIGALDRAARDYLEASKLGDKRRMTGSGGRSTP
jgi:Tfp pilus assembly protein PilF